MVAARCFLNLSATFRNTIDVGSTKHPPACPSCGNDEWEIITLRSVIPRAGAVLAFTFLLCTSLASAQKAIDITADYIAGVRLGMTQPRASAILRRPLRIDRLEEGYLRVVSGNQRVEVYFQKGSPGVMAVTTWNRQLKTDKQVGPCSSVAALKRAYGARLKPFTRAKRIVAYRMGNLIFTVAPGRKVGVVALGRTAPSVYIALNAPACS
jgi:hypothetical protein